MTNDIETSNAKKAFEQWRNSDGFHNWVTTEQLIEINFKAGLAAAKAELIAITRQRDELQAAINGQKDASPATRQKKDSLAEKHKDELLAAVTKQRDELQAALARQKDDSLAARHKGDSLAGEHKNELLAVLTQQRDELQAVAAQQKDELLAAKHKDELLAALTKQRNEL